MRTTNYTTATGPEFTPPIIKYLILLTSISSVLAVLSDNLLKHLIGARGISEFFSLSLEGAVNFELWQPFTYFFFYNAAPGTTISFFWLLGLAFNMYILWVMGSNIAERVTAYSFAKMYLLSGAIAGIAAISAILITGYTGLVCGPGPCILATLLVWSMLNPNSDLLLFFVIPIKSRWLVAGILITVALITLSGGQFVELTLYTVGTLVGYLYALWGWNLRSPFEKLHAMDEQMIALKNKVSIPGRWKKRGNGKIYDFHTGRPIERDEQFMDAMLDKISKHGKESLTWMERFKMNRIAKRKK